MSAGGGLPTGTARAFRRGVFTTPGTKTGTPAPKEAGYKARKARAADAQAIHALIAHYAAQGLLLPRTEEDVREHVGRFLVLEETSKSPAELGRRVVGCVALESYGADLAEIRSLAVAPGTQGHGVGARLLRFAVVMARRRRIARIFAVTHAPEFFARQGFVAAKRQSIPEKVERDCCACPKQRACQLVAVVYTVLPERAALPVIAAGDSTPTA